MKKEMIERFLKFDYDNDSTKYINKLIINKKITAEEIAKLSISDLISDNFFINCVKYNKYNIVKYFLDKKVNQNDIYDSSGIRAVFIAAEYSDLDIFKLMLERGADIKKGKSKYSIGHYASGSQIIDYLFFEKKIKLTPEITEDLLKRSIGYKLLGHILSQNNISPSKVIDLVDNQLALKHVKQEILDSFYSRLFDEQIENSKALSKEDKKVSDTLKLYEISQQKSNIITNDSEYLKKKTKFNNSLN